MFFNYKQMLFMKLFILSEKCLHTKLSGESKYNTNFGQRQRIGNVALALFAILNTAHPLYASYFEVKYLLFLRQSGKHAVLAKLSATVRNIHRCTSSSAVL